MKSQSGKVIVALIQMSCSAEVRENMEKILARIEEAARQGAQIVATQELFRSQYFCRSEDHDNFKLAESIPGPSTEALSKLAAGRGLVIIGSLFERRAGGLYHSTAVVMDADGKLAGVYRKMHIPDDPLYYEKFYFTPGDLGFKAIDTKHGKVGTLVCWDQWYPEAARLTALQGAPVLFYPTAIGWHPSEKAEWGETQVQAWQTMQRSHAIANGVYVVGVNRIGHEGDKKAGIEFFGSSFIFDPYGRTLAMASHDKGEVLTAAIDTDMVETARQHWPFLRDRRIDAYTGLTQRHLEK